MGKVLLLLAVIAGFFAIAPLVTLISSGRRGAWEAVKGQAVVWGIFAAFGVIGTVIAYAALWLGLMQ